MSDVSSGVEGLISPGSPGTSNSSEMEFFSSVMNRFD